MRNNGQGDGDEEHGEGVDAARNNSPDLSPVIDYLTAPLTQKIVRIKMSAASAYITAELIYSLQPRPHQAEYITASAGTAEHRATPRNRRTNTSNVRGRR